MTIARDRPSRYGEKTPPHDDDREGQALALRGKGAFTLAGDRPSRYGERDVYDREGQALALR